MQCEIESLVTLTYQLVLLENYSLFCSPYIANSFKGGPVSVYLSMWKLWPIT